jgi:DNA-binding response OmpR family regulator
MLLRSLLLCAHGPTAQLVSRALKEVGVNSEHCSEPQDLLQRLKNERFDAIVVDDADPGAALVLDSAASLKPCSNVFLVVLTKSQTALGTAFARGSHLVLYKPVSADRLRSSLRAVSTLIGRRRLRKCKRLSVNIPAMLHIDGKTHVRASIVDISEGGVAIATEQAIAPAKNLQMEFLLPGSTSLITTSVNVVWHDVRGRFGAQFVDLAAECAKVVNDWVTSQLNTQRFQKLTDRIPS